MVICARPVPLELGLRTIPLGIFVPLTGLKSYSVLRLRTICYIEPVLVFGTEQDIIVNSHRLSPQRSQRSDLVEFDELHKECLLRKRYCLSEFESEVSHSGLTKF
jgi:hypothetical protein